MSGYVGNRGFNPVEVLTKYGNSQKFMNWFNINFGCEISDDMEYDLEESGR